MEEAFLLLRTTEEGPKEEGREGGYAG